MQIRIKYFAAIREAIGQSSEDLQTNAASVAQLRSELIARGSAYAHVLHAQKAVRVALNQVMCEESAVLSDGAEVAFFPPVTGG